MAKTVKISEEIIIPSDVEIELKGYKISLKGKKGSVSKDFSFEKRMDMALVQDGSDKKITINALFPKNKTVATIYTIINHIKNMIKGVQEEYTYKMKIVYSHFPITVVAPKKGSNKILINNFIGERGSRITTSIGVVKIKTNKEEVIVSGCNKEDVAQTCANIQIRCKIKSHDKRVFKDGVYVYSKQVGDAVFWSLK